MKLFFFFLNLHEKCSSLVNTVNAVSKDKAWLK